MYINGMDKMRKSRFFLWGEGYVIGLKVPLVWSQGKMTWNSRKEQNHALGQGLGRCRDELVGG